VAAAHKPLGLVILLFLLAPSAAFLVRFEDLPRFGELHDDSLYFVAAKSLAEGKGYRIQSLPGEPWQTKYPPLYPLLLSVAWRVNPNFPQNLGLAGWLSWLALPAVLVQLAWVFPKLGFSPGRTWILLTLFALNPYVILFSTQLLTELWYLALALAAMQLLERGARRPVSPLWIHAAGLVAGAAYLTRSAGLALFAAGVLYFWIQRERKEALYFAAAVAPFVVAWTAWAKMHQTPTDDPQLLYYLDYFRYQLYAVPFGDYPVVLWKNLDGILWGLGSLVLPKVTSSLFMKILSEVIAVAMIAGVVRMLRRGHGLLFALFALFSCLLLLVWHFPANERFMLPVFPLALAGLVVEVEHFSGLLRAGLRHPDRSQRVVAGGLMAAAGLIAAGVLGLQLYMGAAFLPEDARQHRARKIDRLKGYGWINASLPADTALLALDDVVLYLYTGRKAMTRPMPPFLWYRQDSAGMIEWISDNAAFARRHGLTAMEFAGAGISLGLEDKDRAEAEKRLSGNPDWVLAFQSGPVRIFRAAQP
jgi:hypothetical protein